MFPISMANVGEKNIISKITGKDEVRQHLAELGFVVGEEITVLAKTGGNMIISIKDGRVGIDKSMTTRIMV